MPVAHPFTAVLESGINAVLRHDPEARRRLGELHGRRIRLRIESGQETWLLMDVLPDEAGLRLRPPAGDARADVEITTEPGFFVRLPGRAGATPAAGELRIRGDLALGNRFREILEQLDPDFEEALAPYTGDVVAHQLGRLARGAFAFGRAAADTLARDAAEYFREEAQLLARRDHVEQFLKDVDRLRDDLARLEQRVQRLARSQP
jgi:ubiquinone biosynthesis protein UbiJ